MAVFELPRLPLRVKLVDAAGHAQALFQLWWQKVVEKIEAQEAIQDQLIADLAAAQAELEATQAELTATQADLAAAVADLAATQADLAATQADVSTAQTDLTQVQADIANLEASMIAIADTFNLVAFLAGANFTGAVDVQAALRCDSLRIDQGPTAETVTPTHTVTVSLNGTDYKLPAVAA